MSPFAPLLVLVLLQPTASETVRRLTQDMQRADLAVQAMQKRVEASAESTRTDDHPWILQADYGVPGGSLQVVRPDTPMRFTLRPRPSEGIVEPPAIEVEVCRGSRCHSHQWQWRCEMGHCTIGGSAERLLGEDAGKHLLTFTLKAKLDDLRQEWRFVAAAAGS